MHFYSTRGKSALVSFAEAIRRGLAEDGGLFLPQKIPQLPPSFWAVTQSFHDIAIAIAHEYIESELTPKQIECIVHESFDFPIPLLPLEDDLYVLELFHGPTLSFKDFGARFMAKVISQLATQNGNSTTILVATSGDTGSAVAAGFHGVPHTRVILLYPSGCISEIQERQLTSWGDNVLTLEVAGSFDDCQILVKQAFQDSELRLRHQLTSANSINIARLLPQSFYYMYAACHVREPATFMVPSGNLGNLTGGVLAAKSGMPLVRFIASANRNDVFPAFLRTGRLQPQRPIRTISNSMDVGNPSNLERIITLYGGDLNTLRKEVGAASFSDEQTLTAMREVHTKWGYVMDPHTAVAYCGWRQMGNKPNIILATAHPAKFVDVVQNAIGLAPDIPLALQVLLNRPKRSIMIPAEFYNFKELLMGL